MRVVAVFLLVSLLCPAAASARKLSPSARDFLLQQQSIQKSFRSKGRSLQKTFKDWNKRIRGCPALASEQLPDDVDKARAIVNYAMPYYLLLDLNQELYLETSGALESASILYSASVFTDSVLQRYAEARAEHLRQMFLLARTSDFDACALLMDWQARAWADEYDPHGDFPILRLYQQLDLTRGDYLRAERIAIHRMRRLGATTVQARSLSGFPYRFSGGPRQGQIDDVLLDLLP